MLQRYYGKNYDKAMKSYDESKKRARMDLLKKYPHATISKFSFDPVVEQDGTTTRVDTFFINSDVLSTDIKSSTFLDDKSMTKWLYNNIPFPKIWLGDGTVQKLLLTDSSMDRDSGKVVKFPPYTLNYQLHNFYVYVDDTNFFKSNLPKVVIKTKKMFRDGPNGSLISAVWTLNKDYYQAIAAMYIATFRSGISLQHLTPSDDIPKQITSLMRFHVYFTMRRVMFRCDKGDIGNILRLYVPDYRLLMGNLPLGGDWNTMIKDLQGDYRRYCPRVSDGITELGQELLNQSIEVYMYALLGAQAKSKQSIVGTRASSREVQQVFRNIVEDAVIQYSPDVWINLMNKAVGDTNVKLDMVVTPNTWLIPRRMVLLKTPIPGYNNLLRVSSETSMTFGYNDGLNFKKPLSQETKPKKTHTDGGEGLETLDVIKPKKTKLVKKNPEDNRTLYTTALFAMVGVMIGKFIM